MLCFNGDASVYGNYCMHYAVLSQSSLIINMISILVLSDLFW